MSGNPIDVCITVDTEFDIAGTFDDPATCTPVAEENVYWNIDGRSHGLGFLLDTLARFDLPATFFVETMNVSYFGDERMGVIARRLHEAGHDVQLHVHPCWTYFDRADWRERLKTQPPNDSLIGRDEHEVSDMFRRAIAIFARWGLPRPVALRTGGLRVDRRVYRLMRDAGIDVASNIGLAVFVPAERELHLYSGRHDIDDVLETPVLTYGRISIGPWRLESTLTVTGSSWREIRHVMYAAQEAAVTPVVLLTHPHEFIKREAGKVGALGPNRRNQERFVRLCEFLAQNRQRFRATTIAAGHARWRQLGASENRRLSVSSAMGMLGALENKINDRF